MVTISEGWLVPFSSAETREGYGRAFAAHLGALHLDKILMRPAPLLMVAESHLPMSLWFTECRPETETLMDLLYLLVVVLFFALSWALVRLCARLAGAGGAS